MHFKRGVCEYYKSTKIFNSENIQILENQRRYFKV